MNKKSIIEALSKNHQSFCDFISKLDEQQFEFVFENKWTAGQQLEHIIRSVSPVKMALSIPKFVTGLIFGKADRDSVGYETLVQNYQDKLRAGGKASGRFLPSKTNFEQKPALVANLQKEVSGLSKRIDRCSEDQLDMYILPHPILGKLTVREMLYFTIYHIQHHHLAAAKNLENRLR